MCRSGIAGVVTTAAQELDAEEPGVLLLLTTPGKNCGGGAGEEENVSLNFSDFCVYPGNNGSTML